MFSAILAAAKAHLANSATTLEQKKGLLESIHDSDKWQECIASIIEMVEDDVFQSEFSTDIASVETPTLLTYEQTTAITRELEHRASMSESLERWIKDPNNRDLDPRFVDLVKRYTKDIDEFNNTKGEWEVWELMSECKNMEQKTIVHRIIMSRQSTYLAWLKGALSYFIHHGGATYYYHHHYKKMHDFIGTHCIKMLDYLNQHDEKAMIARVKAIIIEAYEQYSNKGFTWDAWARVTLTCAVHKAIPEYTDIYTVFENGVRKNATTLYRCEWDIEQAMRYGYPADDQMKAIMLRYAIPDDDHGGLPAQHAPFHWAL